MKLRSLRHCAALLPLLGGGILLPGCRTAPLAPIPEPLPEALPWNEAEGPANGGAFLGLETHENDSGSLDDLFFSPGVEVGEVVENSPAAAAGFRVADVVLAFGAEEVNDPGTLVALVRAATPGERVGIEVRRGDTVQMVEVELAARADGRRPDPEVLYRLDPHRSRAGWATDVGGVRLVSSAPDAPFPAAGVPVGSRVVALDGEPVHSDRALIRRLATRAPGERVRVDAVLTDGTERTTDVRLQTEPRRVTEVSVPILFTYRADARGESSSFVILDLWIISLYRYAREGKERTYKFLRFFSFSRGVGELDG